MLIRVQPTSFLFFFPLYAYNRNVNMLSGNWVILYVNHTKNKEQNLQKEGYYTSWHPCPTDCISIVPVAKLCHNSYNS